MQSPAALDQLAVVDSEIQELIKDLPATWQPQGDDPVELVKRMRAGYDRMPLPPLHPDVEESQLTYTTRDGAELRLCIFKPENPPTTGIPLLVWFHGGGSCIGRPELSSAFIREVVLDHQFVVVAPQYRLAPEHKFPTQFNDGWDAVQHIASIAKQLSAKPLAGFIVGGESAGAVISACLALQARDSPLQPPLTGVYLSAGSYFNPDDIPAQYRDSYRSRNDPACINSPMLSKPVKAAFDACVQGDYSSPLFKAALWPGGHAGLPKTYLQTCGMDINRDDGIMYADLLEKSGVQTRLDVYPGCPHCFWNLFPSTAQGKKWQSDTTAGLKWLLEG